MFVVNFRINTVFNVDLHNRSREIKIKRSRSSHIKRCEDQHFSWNTKIRGFQTGVHVPPGVYFDFSRGTLQRELKLFKGRVDTNCGELFFGLQSNSETIEWIFYYRKIWENLGGTRAKSWMAKGYPGTKILGNPAQDVWTVVLGCWLLNVDAAFELKCKIKINNHKEKKNCLKTLRTLSIF